MSHENIYCFFFSIHEEAIVSLKFEDLFFQLTIYGMVA